MREKTQASEFVAVAGPRFARALERAPVGADAMVRLSAPQRVVKASLRVRGDDGALRSLTSWRVQYSDGLGPMKGGLRFHPKLDETELTSLAFRILVKCAVNGLPHGGAAGGVAVDTTALSRRELEAVSRAYVDAYADVIGPERDILSPDLYTDATVMGWMSDEYNKLERALRPGAINGKGPGRGGIPGRPTATAKGAATVLAEILSADNRALAGMSCAVQGFGAAGASVALELHTRGVKVVSVGDSRLSIYDAKGLDVPALARARKEGKRLRDSTETATRGAEIRGAADVLTLPVDILVPAATGNQIHAQNVANVRCAYLLEIANGPVAPDAEDILVANGVKIIPDVLANAGGITVSHFEWLQNRSGRPWTEETVHRELEERMTATTRAVIRTAATHDVALTIAAQLRALLSLQDALTV